MLEMTDGVSLARGGGAIQAKSRPRVRENLSSHDMSAHQRQFMSKLNSAKREMQRQPPMSAFLQEQSILSEGQSPLKNLRTPHLGLEMVSSHPRV